MSSAVSALEGKARLHSAGELAFLDVREAGEFGEGHPLFATPCPYSRLELMAPNLVPRSDAPVILLDAGNGVAERAARRLQAIGYSEVAWVAGGAPAWEAAGLTLFKGVNVPSKTLGELAEAAWHPDTVDAATLNRWRQEGREYRLFDARPAEEHRKMRVPGSRCLPNGELAHRFAGVEGADTPVVVHCAGRTRSITGAIGLALAGIGSRVLALENGTQGWALAGLELERGAAAEPYPELDDAALDASRKRAQALCARWNIPRIAPADLAGMQADRSRTTFLFDVRSREEYEAGHWPGAVHAPSGQLVQAADQWIGVRRARVVLTDDTGLRAALAAFWLRQMRWECYVLARAVPPPLPARAGEGGKPPAATEIDHRQLPLITSSEAAAGLASGTHILLDLRSSRAFSAAHPAGAEWAIRPRLMRPPVVPSAARGEGGSAPQAVLLSDDPGIAELAAIDLRDFAINEIRLLDGGMDAWRTAGLPVEVTPDRPSPAEAIDFLRFVHDRHDGNVESSRQYLAWEQGLVAQLDPEERAEFQLERPTPG